MPSWIIFISNLQLNTASKHRKIVNAEYISADIILKNLHIKNPSVIYKKLIAITEGKIVDNCVRMDEY